MEMSGAQIITDRLIRHEATTVFGYPGAAVLPLYDELLKNSGKIKHVLTAHEQGAVHAADGYARASGKTGVAIATSGPGATNMVTGIANAYLDNVPLVAITGNVPVTLMGRDSFQEVDIVGITQAVVKHSYVARDVKNLGEILDEAFQIAEEGRRGPVLVDIPKNVQTERRVNAGDDYENFSGVPGKPADGFDAEKIIRAIQECERPFIYAGGGVIAGGAQEELRLLSERIGAPVGLSMMGVSAVPDSYALNMGMCGLYGKRSANAALAECDLLIAAGVRFSDHATGDAGSFAKGKTIIHIDIDVAEIGKNIPPQIEVCADVRDVFKAVLRGVPEMRRDGWLTRALSLKQTGAPPEKPGFWPRPIIEAVQRVCDAETVIATDVGQHQIWAAHYYRFQNPRTFLTSGGLGAMGYGMGAAIGGCLAKGGKRTVLFTGDGSFGMNLIELATAVSEELPITVIIMNNGALGLPRQWQGMFYGGRYSQSTLNRKTDFAALTEAFGACGRRAGSLSDLNEALSDMPDNVPTVIDCMIDMDERTPFA